MHRSRRLRTLSVAAGGEWLDGALFGMEYVTSPTIYCLAFLFVQMLNCPSVYIGHGLENSNLIWMRLNGRFCVQGRVLMHGFLFKKSGFYSKIRMARDKWQRRWVVLSDARLFYLVRMMFLSSVLVCASCLGGDTFRIFSSCCPLSLSLLWSDFVGTDCC